VKKEVLDGFKMKIFPFDLTPTQLDKDDQLIVAHHPFIDGKQQPRKLSFQRCKKLLGMHNVWLYNLHICICASTKHVGFFVFYGCVTYKGSSGSPVLKIVDEKLRVVAVHRACQKKYLNYGTEFSAILSHATLIDEEG